MASHKQIIDELGGIRPLARKLGHNSHTKVQGWRDRDCIPIEHWQDVLRASQGSAKPLTTDDLMPPELRGAA